MAMVVAATLAGVIRCQDWVRVLACPKMAAQLSRPVPAPFIVLLLDAFIESAGGDFFFAQGAVEMKGAPQRPHGRLQSKAGALRELVERWLPAAMVPPEIVTAAREMLIAFGIQPALGWDVADGGSDLEADLLWPDGA